MRGRKSIGEVKGNPSQEAKEEKKKNSSTRFSRGMDTKGTCSSDLQVCAMFVSLPKGFANYVLPDYELVSNQRR